MKTILLVVSLAALILLLDHSVEGVSSSRYGQAMPQQGIASVKGYAFEDSDSDPCGCGESAKIAFTGALCPSEFQIDSSTSDGKSCGKCFLLTNTGGGPFEILPNEYRGRKVVVKIADLVPSHDITEWCSGKERDKSNTPNWHGFSHHFGISDTAMMKLAGAHSVCRVHFQQVSCDAMHTVKRDDGDHKEPLWFGDEEHLPSSCKDPGGGTANPKMDNYVSPEAVDHEHEQFPLPHFSHHLNMDVINPETSTLIIPTVSKLTNRGMQLDVVLENKEPKTITNFVVQMYSDPGMPNEEVCSIKKSSLDNLWGVEIQDETDLSYFLKEQNYHDGFKIGPNEKYSFGMVLEPCKDVPMFRLVDVRYMEDAKEEMKYRTKK